jgi:transportin-3
VELKKFSSYFRIAMAMKTMIDLQLAPISNLLDKAGQNGSQIVCNSTSDPVLYLDRLAAIFSHVNIELEPGQPHPLASLATQDVWPILARNFSVFTADSRIMERTCRTLRFVIRCVGTQSATLVKPLVQMMVSLYVVHPHSCFLYLVSFKILLQMILLLFTKTTQLITL